MPLDVDKGIELPQLELISTKNDDCTTEYSTGKKPITINIHSHSGMRDKSSMFLSTVSKNLIILCCF